MPEESDPPRKYYGLKPRDFERANANLPPPAPPDAAAPAADPGVVAHSSGKIDVRELVRAGASPGAQLGSNQIPNRANEVHAMLDENYRRAEAAGGFALGELDDSKPRLRFRAYVIAMLVVNVPCGLVAWKVGPTDAYFFVFAIAAMALVSSYLTWQTFFLRTHY
jgi:hypothetical protein